MRILGAIMLVLGLLLSLTIIGALIGIPMMFVGLVLVIAGRSKPNVIVHVTQNGPQYHPHANPQPPQPHYNPPASLPENGIWAEQVRDARAPHLPPSGPEGPHSPVSAPPAAGPTSTP